MFCFRATILSRLLAYTLLLRSPHRKSQGASDHRTSEASRRLLRVTRNITHRASLLESLHNTPNRAPRRRPIPAERDAQCTITVRHRSSVHKNFAQLQCAAQYSSHSWRGDAKRWQGLGSVLAYAATRKSKPLQRGGKFKSLR